MRYLSTVTERVTVCYKYVGNTRSAAKGGLGDPFWSSTVPVAATGFLFQKWGVSELML